VVVLLGTDGTDHHLLLWDLRGEVGEDGNEHCERRCCIMSGVRCVVCKDVGKRIGTDIRTKSHTLYTRIFAPWLKIGV
jgi:hypothetical protein